MQMRISFMSPLFLPLVLFAVVAGMMVVVILGRASVVIGKSKSDRCRNSYCHTGFDCDRACVTAMSIVIMDHASLKNETYQK
jgi:ABC-type molybdate transport system permease subunit